ncbi:hypothetical protein V8G54_020550 [Vigna mungo]|uniref:Uncharacterized protein n=1 Tax=Vigna mungo TaxID=3915 RepID=A0AAQ3RWI1_VIGMU
MSEELANSRVRVSICISLSFSGFGLSMIHGRYGGTIWVARLSRFGFCRFAKNMIHSGRRTKTRDHGGVSLVCVLIAIWGFSQSDLSGFQVFMEAQSWCSVELAIFAIEVSSQWLNDDLLCAMKLMGARRVKDTARSGDWNEHGGVAMKKTSAYSVINCAS